MSQAASRPRPPARTWPVTRATTGLGRATICRIRATRACGSGGAVRSAPAQKVLPVWVRTTARTVPSAAHASRAAESAATRGAESALRLAGESRVSVVMPRSWAGAASSAIRFVSLCRAVPSSVAAGRRTIKHACMIIGPAQHSSPTPWAWGRTAAPPRLPQVARRHASTRPPRAAYENSSAVLVRSLPGMWGLPASASYAGARRSSGVLRVPPAAGRPARRTPEAAGLVLAARLGRGARRKSRADLHHPAHPQAPTSPSA